MSVIIPVRNGENFLTEALESVLANINAQDELILVDDGSTDNTASLIHHALKGKARYCLLNGPAKGPAHARNLAISHASGSFIAFIDHDDRWPNGKLARQLALMDRMTNQAGIVGKTQYFSADESMLAEFRFLGDDQSLHHVHLGASLFRKGLFDRVGLFNHELAFSEDHDLFLRIREQGLKLYFDTAIALHYRIHGSNMTAKKTLREMEVMKVLHASIKRRRDMAAKQPMQTFGGTI